MTNPIVTVNVSQQIAPAPNTLQKNGAMISQGATITSPGTKSLLKRYADLAAILKGALAITSITWTGNVATVTTAAPHGFDVGDIFPMTIAAALPLGYNGTFMATITGASAFTYPLLTNPGSNTTPGVYSPEDVSELVAMATTFFAQGNQQAVTVLELGAGSVGDGVTFLTAWIAANPGVFYSYLVPRFWDGVAAFLTFLAGFNNTTSKTYFFVTTTLQNYGKYLPSMKCVNLMIECPAYGIWPANALSALSSSAGAATATTTTAHGVSPGQYFKLAGNLPAGYNGTFLALAGTAGSTLNFAVDSATGAETQLGTLVASQYASAGIPATEFSHAADWWVTLNYKPSSTNKVTPLDFAFLFGVTPFPAEGNASILSTLNAANVNVVATGAQGGISQNILIGGNVLDGHPFNYWYSVDWVQINLALNVTNELILGANNPQNPLYYNQPGINRLQQRSVGTMNNGITNGLVLFPVKPTTLNAEAYAQALDAETYAGFTVVNAEQFIDYATENPDDYKAGAYDGISVEYVPLRGFDSITINVTVSDFVVGG